MVLELRRAQSAAPSDGDLIARIAAGDRTALEDSYRAHGQGVLGAALGVMRNREAAEDIVQEVFLRLWRRPERFDPQRGGLATFLKIDARGRALDALRSSRSRRDREERQQVLDSSEAPVGVEEQVMTDLTAATVRRVLSRLRPEERDAIALAYLEGHSYRRVAEILGDPEGTVKSRIRMGLERLEGMLSAEGLAAS